MNDAKIVFHVIHEKEEDVEEEEQEEEMITIAASQTLFHVAGSGAGRTRKCIVQAREERKRGSSE